MKHLLILAAFLPAFAFAESSIIGVQVNNAGGHNYLVSDPDRCATGFGFMAVLPFQKDPIRGCVTQMAPDSSSIHVYFENGLENDYTTSAFTVVPSKKTAKGAL